MNALARKMGEEISQEDVISEVLGFIEPFVQKEGKITEKTDALVIRELNNFHGFNIMVSEMADEVWVKLVLKSSIVLDVCCQTRPVEKNKICIIAEEGKWLPAFQSAMANKKGD